MRYAEAWSYSGSEIDGLAAGLALPELAPADYVTLAMRYASVAALMLAVNPVTAGVRSYNGVLELFDASAPDKPIRASLGMAIIGSDGQTMLEKGYLVEHTRLDGHEGVMLTPYYGETTWTAGAVAIPAAVGGRTNHKDTKAVGTSDLGVAVARTGVPLGVLSQAPSELAILDIGEVIGVLRLVKKGTATSGVPLKRRWR
jgi:hypothetical protein